MKMKILHINQQDACGGAAAIANCLVERLNNYGIHSELWYFNRKGTDGRYSKCIYPGLEHYRKNIFLNTILSKLVYYHYLYLGDVRNPFFTGVVKRIHEWKPSIIHLHNLHGGWADLMSIAKLSEQIRVIITLHDEWLITGHCGITVDCVGWQDSCSVCPDLLRYIPVNRPITKKLRKEKSTFLAMLAKNKAILVAPTAWIKRQFITSGLWEGGEIIVIPNGIDTSIFEKQKIDKSYARKELNLLSDEKIAFFAAEGGTANPWKGFPAITEALKMFPDKRKFTILVAGDVIESRIIERVKDVDIVKVGYANKETLNKCYAAADIFIYPTKSDNCSLALLEAMAAGLPIIATAVGGNPELIVQKETGILVPKERPDLLMQAILDFMDNKYDYAAMGLKAKERAISFFDKELMVSKYVNLYQKCMNS
ncbi:MAG: glycosyltransferase [Candidatus Brocadia sp.]|nr:D-inositol-3-phosphate glycosyltransferase [Candidatus Brocadia fulgida]MCC6326670.1 glycosyltransferase [Candidatus Brocadia sp.]MDG5997061.1 glycosyltransferase [Candidatus Brocadia sp.]